uniref:(northern house mosquito) hypothetical protein n=1 Tax=Culex pipiens TaxID=7175 RepID=A0A8D8DMA8_CULPI
MVGMLILGLVETLLDEPIQQRCLPLGHAKVLMDGLFQLVVVQITLLIRQVVLLGDAFYKADQMFTVLQQFLFGHFAESQLFSALVSNFRHFGMVLSVLEAVVAAPYGCVPPEPVSQPGRVLGRR